jgi:arabinofuranosyltransferase
VLSAALWLRPMPITYLAFDAAERDPGVRIARPDSTILIPANGWRPVRLQIEARLPGAPPEGADIQLVVDGHPVTGMRAGDAWQTHQVVVRTPVVYPRLFKLQLQGPAAGPRLHVRSVSARQLLRGSRAAGLALLGGALGLLLFGIGRRLPPRPLGQRVVLAACTIVYAVLVLRSAWLSDDAYITLRTVENIVSGLGARWNVAERVQSYTHPLWMLLLIPARWLAGEPYMAIMALSIATALAAFVALLASGRCTAAAVLGAVMLLFSRAFVEYSTGGLENPLTFLLLALFFWRFWSRAERGADVPLVLAASLVVLSRADALLLILPALALGFWRCPSWAAAARALTGCVPLGAWALFAFWYYGAVSPNTALAKLNTAVPLDELVPVGLAYLADSIRRDPFTIGVTLVAAVLAAVQRSAAAWVAVAGAISYYVYIVWIGGDFMAGRFLAAPAYVSALGVAGSRSICGWRPGWQVAAIALLVAAGHASNRGPSEMLGGDASLTRFLDPARRFGDERSNYYPATGLLSTRPLPDATMERGVQARAEKQPVALASAIGMFAFYAGPEVHVLDVLALTDPLLARLPSNRPWRPGHFQRPIPEGYVESLRDGTNVLRDPRMQAYYERIRLVTRGPLWSLERIRTAIGLSTGRYDAEVPREIVTIETPEHESSVSGSVLIGGWALDLTAAADTGVDAVHIYAYARSLASGETPGGPVLLSKETYGGSRRDVAGTYGARFRYAGFSFNVRPGTLAPGTYDIAVFARSRVSGLYNSRSVRIQVR